MGAEVVQRERGEKGRQGKGKERGRRRARD